MKENKNQLINSSSASIVFGTLFSVFSIPFSTMLATFLLGIIGAVGAWIGTFICRWIYNTIKNWSNK